MSLIYLTPGPTQLYPTIGKHIQHALDQQLCSWSHRSQAFSDMYEATVTGLHEVLNIPTSWHVFFLGSATEAMERIVQNLVNKHSFHFVNGAFSKRFFETAKQWGKDPRIAEAGLGKGFDLANTDIPGDTEVICVTQNETSAGVFHSHDQLRALKAAHPDKLVMVDMVSCVPHIAVDSEGMDAAFFSVQKGFGLPAGLGVIAMNPVCLQRAEKRGAQGFHSFPQLAKYGQKFQTTETPNSLLIYLLGCVCRDLLAADLAECRRRWDARVLKIYQTIKEHPQLSVTVTDHQWRSPTVVMAQVDGGSAGYIAAVKERGVLVGGGYGPQKESHIRIANFPAHPNEAFDIL